MKKKRMALEKTSFPGFSSPLASPAPHGGGGACDSVVLPENDFFHSTGNTALSQPGRHSGGAEPRERHHSFNGFCRPDELPNRHELRAVVDDAALAVGSDPAEGALHPHADLHVVRAADDLCGHPRALVKLYNGEDVGGIGLELLVCRVDDGIGND